MWVARYLQQEEEEGKGNLRRILFEEKFEEELEEGEEEEKGKEEEKSWGSVDNRLRLAVGIEEGQPSGH